MMRFRNKRSGIVIEMPKGFSGRNWEPLEAPGTPEDKKQDPETADRKKKSKAKPKG